VVEHVPERAAQEGDVEGLGADQRVLLPHGEQQLEADRRRLGPQPPRDREHHRDRRLVVGA